MLQAFDDLLLLKSGGVVTYHGSLGKHSCRLIEYFQVSSLPACVCAGIPLQPACSTSRLEHLHSFAASTFSCSRASGSLMAGLLHELIT